MQCSPLGKALDKAAYTNGYAKNSLLAALVKLGSMIGHCYLTVWMVVSGHVKENQEISFTKGGTESGSSLQIMLHIACRPTCLEPLLNCQCCFKL